MVSSTFYLVKENLYLFSYVHPIFHVFLIREKYYAFSSYRKHSVYTRGLLLESSNKMSIKTLPIEWVEIS